jgi:predicted metal-binding membrane protein
LAVAGLYQFSSLKYACLDKCRSPLTFLTSRWQGGNETAQALRIGVEHGLFCVGCCWSLMLLMFLVGTASVAWMLLLGVVMALEKNHPLGRRISAPLGWLLLLAAVAVAVRAIR